jgi:apolipoprotein N-acyltransferase
VKRPYLLALLTAFLLWLAWPPHSFTGPLLLFAFVPLLSAIDQVLATDAPRKGSKVFGLSFLGFFAFNTASIYWVFNAISAVMPAWIAFLISLIPFSLGALLMSASVWFYARVRVKNGKLWSYAALAGSWLSYEYLHQSWDLNFPWMTLGNGLANSHRLIQWYEYTGVFGGSLWILTANLLTFELAATYAGRADLARQKKTAALLFAWVALPITFSLLTYSSYTEAPNPSNVVVTQPNIDPYEKWSGSSSEQVAKLIRLSDSAAHPNTEFFIWPETAIPDYVEETRFLYSPNLALVQQFLGKYHNGNVIAGIESYAMYDTAKTPTARFQAQVGRYTDVFNTAVQIENSSKLQFYHKSRLVPGVEKTPFTFLSFLKPLFAKFGGSSGGFGFQDEPTVFYAKSGIGSAPVICYESIYGEYVAQYVKMGAQFITIITNDGWWGNTSGKDQHLAYAKLRAIETRRWVARSANTGISAFINQRGDIVQKTGWWEAKALNQDINLNEELTVYVRAGDYVAWVAILLFAVCLIRTLLPGHKKNGQATKEARPLA